MTSHDDSLAAEIARLEAEIERKRLQQQIQAMEKEIAQKVETDEEEEEEEELIVLTAPKSNWKNVSSERESGRDTSKSSGPLSPSVTKSPTSVHSQTTPRSSNSFRSTKTPVRRSVFLKSITQAASERSDQSENNNNNNLIESKNHQSQIKPVQTETKTDSIASPRFNYKSPVRRSVFLKSVIAASELRASVRNDTSSSSSNLSDNDSLEEAMIEAHLLDEINRQQQAYEDATKKREEELERQRLEAEIRALEESAERTKREIEEELERRSQEELRAQQAEQQMIKEEELREAEKEREAEMQRLKLEKEIRAMEAALAAKARRKKKPKADLQREQLQEECRSVDTAAAAAAAAAETLRKNNEAAEGRKLEDEVRTMEVATERARQKREEELSKLHADHEKVAGQNTGFHRDHPRHGTFFQDIEDEENAKKIEQERLQSEIRQMQAELQKKTTVSGGASVTSRASTSSKTSRKGKPRKNGSKKSLERQRLEEEIARMEAEIQTTALHKPTKSDALPSSQAYMTGIEEAAAEKRVEEQKGSPNKKHEIDSTLSKSNAVPPRPAFLTGIAGAAAARKVRAEEPEETPDTKYEIETTSSKSNAVPTRPAFLAGIEGAAARQKRTEVPQQTVAKKHDSEPVVSGSSPIERNVVPPRPAFLAGIAGAAAARKVRAGDSEETPDTKYVIETSSKSNAVPTRPAFLAGIEGAAAARQKRTEVPQQTADRKYERETVSEKSQINSVAVPSRPDFLAGIAGAAAARQRRAEVPQQAPDRKFETETTLSYTPPIKGDAVSPRPAFLAGIAEAAAAREKRVKEGDETTMTVETLVTHPSTDTESSPTGGGMAMRPNLLSAISGAALDRKKRLEETGGDLQMRDVEPEVEDQRKNTPQPSFALADMVSKMAKDREKRLAAGGEKKMTKVKEKAEYKTVFTNIALEAANMGRLTRLNEHTVEAVAADKTPQQEWRSKGLLAINWRSNHMAIIKEAAALGNQTKMREHVVSNKTEEEEEEWEAMAADRGTSRLNQLLELNKKAGTGTEKVDELVMGLREENQGGDSLLVRPMFAYGNIEEVKLPKPLPPSIDVKKAKQKVTKMEEEAVRLHHPMTDISAHVAEVVWERRARLNRPGSMPKVRQGCDCPYCGTASPYQTFAYREVEKRHKHEMKQMMEAKQAEEQQRKEEVKRLGIVPEVKESAKENAVPTPVVPKPTSAGDKLRQKLEAKKTTTGATVVQKAPMVSKPLPTTKPTPVAKPPVATTKANSTAPGVQRVGTMQKASPEPMVADKGCACVIM